MQHLFNTLLRRPQSGSAQSDEPEPDPHSQPKLSLTEHLLGSTTAEYKQATQTRFLRLAAQGRLQKDVLGRWLGTERLYLHSYIRAAGNLLAGLDLSTGVPRSGEEEEEPEVRLVDWIIKDLVEIREVERRIVDVAGRYGIALEVGAGGEVGTGPGPVEPKIDIVAGRLAGLERMRGVFDSVALPSLSRVETVSNHSSSRPVLPWLEAAVMFWGTERMFVDAWSWARAQQSLDGNGEAKGDADGGAMRTEFIPSWSSDGVREFVARLQEIIDEAVAREIERGGKDVREEVLRRTEGKWRSLVAGAGEFWMGVEEGRG